MRIFIDILPILCEIEFIGVDRSTWKSSSSDGHDPSNVLPSPDPLAFSDPENRLTLVVTEADIRLRVFLKRTRPRAERADGQPLARLTPGFLPLTAMSVP